jgi:hypothetical protein
MAKRSSVDRRAAEHRARSDERAKDVADKLSRLKGSSRDDLFDDQSRGAGSPLGQGTGSKKVRR